MERISGLIDAIIFAGMATAQKSSVIGKIIIPMVKVRSVETNREYEVMFAEEFLVSE